MPAGYPADAYSRALAPVARDPSAAPATTVSAPKTKPAATDPTALVLKGFADDAAFLQHCTQGLRPDSPAYALMSYAISGFANAVAGLLERNNVLPDFAGENGITPLMAAARCGRDEVVEMLARHALVNLGRQTAEGWTALHFAAYAEKAGCVTSLLRHHAPIEAETRQGKTAFQLAEEPVREVFRHDRRFRHHASQWNPGNPAALSPRTP
jgi:hypothetical protein